ncbi:MAG: DUF4466 family protein [Bacteroidales bacterium]|jgi:hypothetical protein|nr:DUF4466 family protein [Bacteroidales bacterium]
MKIFRNIASVILPVCVAFASCSDDSDPVMKNDFIKKTVSPAIAGQQLEFAYAMGAVTGTLGTATAQASIAGAPGTGFGEYSYYTTRVALVVGETNYNAGNDVPLKTVSRTSTSGTVSTATMESRIDEVYTNPSVPYGAGMVDMKAATIRYYYVVPEEAQGKEVSFVFSSKSSAGDEASCSTPAYQVSKMDMKRLIDMANGGARYFSIADMAAYTQAEVESGNLSSKIDFAYIYQNGFNGFTYGHVFISPGSDPKYFAQPLIPGGWTKNKTLMEKRVDVRDAQLKGSIPNVFIDDIDFETLDLSAATDFVLNFVNDEGAFMKTADGKYLAYVYVNSVNSAGTIRVSIKRYPLN